MPVFARAIFSRGTAAGSATRDVHRGSVAIAVSILYVALALASTWPLAAHLDEALPQGTDQAPTVPFFQAWSLWWTSDRIAAGFGGFWDAPIFYPTPKTFAFSDPLLLAGTVSAPIIWAGAPPALAHNLFMILALVLNGGVAFGLLRTVGLGVPAAVAGGAMMVMLPYVHHELGVLMLVPVAGILATLWALVGFTRDPSQVGGLLLGLAVAATYLSCGQYGVFLALVVAPSGLWLVHRGLFRRRALLGFGAALLLCAALVAPLVAGQLEAIGEHGFRRSHAQAVASSTYGTAWLATPWRQLVPLPGVYEVDEAWQQAYFPGTVKMVLAMIGLVWGVRRHQERRWTGLLATAAIVAAIFSVLPRLEFGDFSPFGVLRDVLPGLPQMRSYWRFIVVSQIAVVLLAAQGLEGLLSLQRRRRHVEPEALPARRRVWAAALLGIGGIAAVEVWPAPQTLAPVPDLEEWRPWTEWIEVNLDPGAPLVYLPFARTFQATDFVETTRWMYLTAAHGRPMVNGYSGFFPRPHNVLARLLRVCPTREVYDFLTSIDLRTLVVRSSWLRENPACMPPKPAWQRVFGVESLDVEVYRAAPAGSAPPGAPEARSEGG